MRLKGSAKVLEARRRRALQLLKSDVSLREVARQIGCHASSVMRWRDRLRMLGEEGLKVGCIRLSMIRPFPRERFRRAIANAKHLIIVDRDVSFGAEGIVAQEVKAGLFDRHGDVKLTGFIAGVGGNDVSVETIVPLVRQAISGAGTAVEAGTTLWAEVLP